jgi:hypothetical protein
MINLRIVVLLGELPSLKDYTGVPGIATAFSGSSFLM